MQALLDALREASAAPRRRRLTAGAAAGGIGILFVVGLVARTVPAVGSSDAIATSAPATMVSPVAHAGSTGPRVETPPPQEERVVTVGAPSAAPPAPLASARRRNAVIASGSPSAPRRLPGVTPSALNPTAQVGTNGAMILE